MLHPALLPGTVRPGRIARVVALALGILAVLAATASGAYATTGKIRVIKGGDRAAGVTSNRTYAAPLAGATFEYTTSAADAKDPASAGWLAFPAATDANGVAEVSVAPGTYYVRERASAAGFLGYGPVRSLAYDPGSNVPAAAQPYVAKVVVNAGATTEAYPNRTPSGDTGSWSSNGPGAEGSPFVNVRDNPAFPSVCGINVLLVLDRSGSIAGHEDDYEHAANAFVSSLAGTPTQIGILSFSAGDVNSYQAPASGDAARTHAPVDLSAPGSAALLNDTIANVYDGPAGGTDWDMALQKAAAAQGFAANGATGQTSKPDVVVFITDGNPTARSTAGSDGGSGVDLLDLSAGMASANLVKSRAARAGTRLKLYALGVGGGVTAANLKAVSGPALGEDYETPTIAELTAKLTELAARTCGARIYVRKRVDDGAADRPGWAFSGASSGGAVSYLDGDRRTHATGGGRVETGVIVTRLPAAGAQVTLTEDASGQPLGDVELDGVSCRSGGYDGGPAAQVAPVERGVKVAVTRGATLYCTFTNVTTRPALRVVKEGSQFAYPGDTVNFTFAVTNPGNTPLQDVAVTDDRCAPVTGPVERRGDNGDGLLDPGETWIFACARQIPAGHGLGDENPIRNVATATATDGHGKTVTAQDDHLVRVLHPAVDIEKTGPASAMAGTALGYVLTVTNPGDVPFAAQEVVVADPRCEAPPAGPATGADATPGQLDPGDTWTYTCTAQTPGQPAGSFVNTATVTAKDFNGRAVTDSDAFTTVLEAQAVAPSRIASGTARLRGASGCVHRRFAVTVRGTRIARVTFFRDGKRIKRISARPGQRSFTLRIKPARGGGVHRISAKVRFESGSQTRTRTLRLSYQRCRSQVVRPRFTG